MNQYSWFTVGYIIPTCLSTGKYSKCLYQLALYSMQCLKHCKIINCCTIVTAMYITFVHLYTSLKAPFHWLRQYSSDDVQNRLTFYITAWVFIGIITNVGVGPVKNYQWNWVACVKYSKVYRMYYFLCKCTMYIVGL